jgi:hypothetical protein
LLEFVKSIDAVFKEARLLRASVRNSEKIDRGLEKVFNVIFYTIIGCILLSYIGVDPFALFLSLSSVIVAFAFAIGSASAKIFEGILFILVRRPVRELGLMNVGAYFLLRRLNPHFLIIAVFDRRSHSCFFP